MQTETTKSKLIKAVQTGKGKLGLKDDEYRAMLQGICGKESCKDMDESELKTVLTAMRKLGFKPVYTSQMNLVRHLWIAMHEEGIVKDGSDTAINSYCRRIESVGVALRDADPMQVRTVVETLKKWIARIKDKNAQARLNQIMNMEKPATAVVQ